MEDLVNNLIQMNKEFWSGKKVYITGHTGFKGSWTTLWLTKLGAIVKGYSLEPKTNPSLFYTAKVSNEIDHEIGDITNLKSLKRSIQNFKPEIVIHMAAQPLVRFSYKNPVETYSTNVMGSVNIFEAVRSCESIRAVVNVTSDKCYQNREWDWGYREEEPMGGHDPYSSSKGCSELITAAYRNSFFSEKSSAGVASARAGNVIGGGDWSDDRLIPDLLKAFDKEEDVLIRNPSAIRPWQHVLEPISGYLQLAEKLYFSKEGFDEGWNFGPNDNDVLKVSEVLDYFVKNWPKKSVNWKQDFSEHPHEANLLKLDISKSKNKLKWKPILPLDQTLQSIIDWHIAWRNGENMRDVTLNQITNYEEKLNQYNE